VSALTKGANKALEQLRQLRNRQYYPLVLSALTSEKISDEVSQLIIDISSVAVRRSIIGKNPNELESFFSENASKLRRKEITIFDLRQTLFKDFWINDEQILLELRSMDFSDQEYLAKFILKEYEIDKGVEEKKLGKVSLEHVLPRNPENLDDWGITEDKKNEIVWNLGNLALIGQTYNSKMSNKSFKKKLPFLKKSEIKTTASIATLENWDEGSILERNNKLGDFIVKCWKKS
jgi:hypothetical protein